MNFLILGFLLVTQNVAAEDRQYRDKCREKFVAAAAAELGWQLDAPTRRKLEVSRVMNASINPEFNIVVEFLPATSEGWTMTPVAVLADLNTCEVLDSYRLVPLKKN